jgi:hypothetical protein
MLKRIVTGGAAALIGVSVWGIAGEDNSTRDESGQIVVSGEVGAFVTKLGDCLESLPDGKSVSTVPGVPCGEPHHWQVYHKEESSLSDFDEALIVEEANRICSSALENIVPKLSEAQFEIYEDSDGSYFAPTATSWEKGDRTIDCLRGSDLKFYTTSFLP